MVPIFTLLVYDRIFVKGPTLFIVP
jgi:hypothetical protein